MPNAMLELLAQSRQLHEQAESPMTHPRRKPALKADAEELYNQALDMREMGIRWELERMAGEAGLEIEVAFLPEHFEHHAQPYRRQIVVWAAGGRLLAIHDAEHSLEMTVVKVDRHGWFSGPSHPYDPAAIIEAVRKVQANG